MTSILPKEEPMMQTKDDSFINSIQVYKDIAIKSAITQLSEVREVLSNCQMLIGPFNNVEEILPLCSDILSEIIFRKVTDVTARIQTWASRFPGKCANHYTTVTARRAESDLCAAPFRPTITCGISRLYRI